MDLIAAWPWLLAGLIVFMALLALWWWFPQWQLKKLWTRWPSLTPTDFKVLADVEDNFRKTIGQLLAGAAVLVGAGLAYLQFTQQQQNSAEQFRQQQQAAQSLLISNQVAKGFEQLAGEKLEMRLGGIYALEGVMNVSERYHKPVLEALSAFVRERTKGKGTPATLPPGADIQAVLTIIGRREILRSPGRNNLPVVPDLSYANIPKASLYRANLSGASLEGADLRGADLQEANLSGAYLYKANLSGGALMYKANLSGANLSDANLRDAALHEAILVNVNLTRVDLRGSTITQTQLNAVLCGTDAKLDPPLTIKPCPPDR